MPHRAVLQRMSEIVFECDAEGRLLFLNPAWTDQLGRGLADSLNLPLTDVLVEEDRLAFAEMIGQSDPATTHQREVRLTHADGTSRWFALAARGGAEPGTWVGTLHNMETRKRIEAELHERTQLALLIAEVHGALNQTDAIEVVLQRCAVIFQQHLEVSLFRIWTFDEADGALELRASAGWDTQCDGFQAWIPLGTSPLADVAVRRQAYRADQVADDPRICDPAWGNGGRIISIASYPLIVEDRVVGVMAAFASRPMTDAVPRALSATADVLARYIERKRAEAGLRHARESTELAQRDRSECVANLCHEVRAPIAAILSQADLMMESRMSFEERMEVLHSIQRHGKHLLRIIHDVLDPTGQVNRSALEHALRGSADGAQAEERQAASRPSDFRTPTPAPHGPKPRVLLVEDSKDNQYLLSYMLAKLGLDVDLAENGQEGVDRAMADQHDIVLMDMQMPELDGYAAARRLREQGFTRPIVALTAHAMNGDRERCLDAGCDDYLTKPTRKEELRDVIARQLRRNPKPLPAHHEGEMERMTEDYQRSLSEQLACLQSALDRGDCKTVQQIAVRMQGTAGTFGFPEVTENAELLESALREGQDRELLSDLVREMSEAASRPRPMCLP